MQKEDLIPIFSTDAFSSFLLAMKNISKFGKLYFHIDLCVPLFCDITTDMKVMQDPIHFLNKFRNQLIENLLKLGDKVASINFLRILLNNENVSKNDHMLNNTDVGTFDSTTDKMNANSTQKICNQKVIELLKNHVAGSEGTAAYLQIMRFLYDAFIEPTTAPIDRLQKAFQALIFVRIWRNNLERKESSLFITNQLWTCLELNVAFLYDLVIQGKGHLVLVWNSQPCEETFRTLRSMTSHSLTEINFTFLESMEKLNRVEKVQELAHELRDIFVLEENLKLKSDVISQQKISVASPSLDECHATILKAHQNAIEMCKSLNMKKLVPCNPASFMRHSKKKNVSHQQDEEEDEDEEEEEIDSLERAENLVLEEDIQITETNQKKIVKVKNLRFLDETSRKIKIKL
jgi:hypothetical protein